MSLAASKQLKAECRWDEIGVLIEVEILRLDSRFKKPKIGKLKDIAIDLHQIVRAGNLNEILGSALNRKG